MRDGILRRSGGLLRLTVFLLAGCGVAPRSIPPPTALAAVQTLNPESFLVAACHERAVGLQSWLREVDDLGWPLSSSLLDGGVHLVARSGPSLDEPGPVVHLTSSEQALDGMRYPNLAFLGEHLAEAFEVRHRALESSPFIGNSQVYLAIDADVAWSRVVELAERVVAAGANRVAFVFFDSSRAVPSLAPSIIDRDLGQLSRASASKRGQIVAESLAFVYQQCPSALQLIGQFGQDVPEVQQALVERLPAALENCQCAVDDASVRSLHWALFGDPRPASRVTVALVAASNRSARVLSAAASTPWQAAHELILSTERAPTEFAALAVDGGLSVEPIVAMRLLNSNPSGKRP